MQYYDGYVVYFLTKIFLFNIRYFTFCTRLELLHCVDSYYNKFMHESKWIFVTDVMKFQAPGVSQI